MGARDRAYDTPLLGGLRLGAMRRKTWSRRVKAGTTAADAAASAEGLSFGGAGTAGSDAAAGAGVGGGWAWGSGRRRPTARTPARARARRARQPKKAEQLTLAATTDGQLHAAACRPAEAGHGGQGADQGQ